MMNYSIINGRLICVLCISAVASCFALTTRAQTPSFEGEHAIEVVFVLDTTGSMSGLIEGAKRKIWSIANAIASADPRPAIRMGLVGYRDRGDAYITRTTPLSVDIDAIYADLTSFSASGGGDTPESVNQALDEAVHGFDWSADETSLRVIYLVGDAPPHLDYEQDVAYQLSCQEAASRGIFINTIRCGSIRDTEKVWQEIARLGEGEYFSIAQNGGVVTVSTPFDADLASLADGLSETALVYGDTDDRARKLDRLNEIGEHADEAPRDVAASRAEFLGVIGRVTVERDLVELLDAGELDFDEISESDLPANLQGLERAQQLVHIQEQSNKRSLVRKQIQELSRKRQSYLQKSQSKQHEGFDQKVIESLRRQAAMQGFVIPEPTSGANNQEEPSEDSNSDDEED